MCTSATVSGSRSTWYTGTYLGARYACTCEGSCALSATFPWAVLPTGAAKPPAVVVDDMEMPTTNGTGCGGVSGGGSFGGGGASSTFGGGSRRATLIGGGFTGSGFGSFGGGGGFGGAD